MHAKYTVNTRSTHEKRIIVLCSPPFSCDWTSRFLVFSGVFQGAKQRIHWRFPPFCVSFLVFSGAVNNWKMPENSVFPNVHPSVNEMFSIVSKRLSPGKRAVFTIRMRLFSRNLYVSSVILCGECNLVLYSLVFSLQNLTSVLALLFFPALATGDLNDIQILRFSPPYPSKETSNEKFSMHFWTLLFPETRTITYTLRVHNNIVCHTGCL